MRDLSKTFYDGGSLHRPDYAAIAIPNGDDAARYADDLVTFHPECFDAQGAFRPEVLVWLRALAADDNASLPFGGMA